MENWIDDIKALAEEVIREEHGSIPYAILRFAGVYDEESAVPTLSNQIARIYEREFESFFYSGSPLVGQSKVHREDLVEAVRLAIQRRDTLPPDAEILIGEPDLGDLEVVPLTSINDRGFSAFSFNPLGSFRPEFFKLEIVDIYQDVKWYFPKLKPGQMLAVPLQTGTENPLCVYFVKDISRQSEVVDYNKAW